MTVRTQITLDPEAHRQAKRRAAEKGISLAEYVRQLVARDLGEPSGSADVTAIFNLGGSEESDVAKNKDRYVAEAFEAARNDRGR